MWERGSVVRVLVAPLRILGVGGDASENSQPPTNWTQGTGWLQQGVRLRPCVCRDSGPGYASTPRSPPLVTNWLWHFSLSCLQMAHPTGAHQQVPETSRNPHPDSVAVHGAASPPSVMSLCPWTSGSWSWARIVLSVPGL